MTSSDYQHFNVKFNYKEEAAPLYKENQNITKKYAKKKGRLHLFSYNGKEGHDYYAIAAEKIFNESNRTPSLNFISRFYNVIVPGEEDGVYYKVNLNSLKNRLGMTEKDLEGLVNKGVIGKDSEPAFREKIKSKLNEILSNDIEELQKTIENSLYCPELIQTLLSKDSNLIGLVFENYIKLNIHTNKPRNFFSSLEETQKGLEVRNQLNQVSYKLKPQPSRENDLIRLVGTFKDVLEKQEIEYKEQLKKFEFFPDPLIIDQFFINEKEKQETLIKSFQDADKKNIDQAWSALTDHLSDLFTNLLEKKLVLKPDSTEIKQLSFSIRKLLDSIFAKIENNSGKETGLLQMLRETSDRMSHQLTKFFDEALIPMEIKKSIISSIVEQKERLISMSGTFYKGSLLLSNEKGKTLDLLSAVSLLKESKDFWKLFEAMKPEDVGIAFHCLKEEKKQEIAQDLENKVKEENQDLANKAKRYIAAIKKEEMNSKVTSYFPD